MYVFVNVFAIDQLLINAQHAHATSGTPTELDILYYIELILFIYTKNSDAFAHIMSHHYAEIVIWSGYVLERRFTKFGEITQCNGHYAV